nr:TaqI-like C-terminal specificity domain-containing protein [uncultured Draconibacterium sp.]
MEIKILKPRKAINKAFLKIKPNRTEIESFKANLIQLLDRTNETESEEFHKNLVSDFLKKTYYEPNYFINTKGRNDLVIHNGNKAKSTVGVIIEAKKPTNKAEMLTKDKINVKAFQELVLYYLRERITNKNLEIKYLVATNINEWFIFDSNIFEKQFSQNKGLVKQFNDFENGRLTGKTTEFFYKEIAEPFINDLKHEIEFTFFDIREYEKPLRNHNPKDDNKLISLFKLLSPEHLLKLPFKNDSNSLDSQFYGELLHIIGLSETKDGSKKVIGRNKTGERNTGALLENAIIQLESLDKINRLNNPSHFGKTKEERLFNVGLELSITWINRILFLKLLEAQLKTYNKGDKTYEFLNIHKIQNYDDLDSLFFQVLAIKQSERNEDVSELFAKVPYLNSSLFEPTEIEHGTLFISNLRDDKTIPIYSSTVLKRENGKKRTGNLSTLEYLFEFLNAYDFSSEGSEEIQEDNKTLINASVLGLIFEKINGYKDGSFFTPGFITMYMCNETIRKAVVQKFNEFKNWNCEDIDSLYDKIDDREEANRIINGLKICDPAVGSGHFLVSALNEIVAIKNDLKILQDRDGKRLKEYQFEVVNDELIVTDEDGELFEYNPNSKESQRIQETLFHEKQTIIENCLFGVDINPNSVKICRLRLWIELLKNAYYKNRSELETLPNIDINIKCGNSLISRFSLDSDLKTALKSSKWSIDNYKIAVDTYRNAQSKEQKHDMEELIATIKSDFKTNIDNPFKKKIRNARTKVDKIAFEINTKKQWGEKINKKLLKDLEKASLNLKKLEEERDSIEANIIYENAFEWRFEFPEVLNDAGEFLGFDVIIGNPPYVQQRKSKGNTALFSKWYSVYSGTADLSIFFFEKAFNLLKENGHFAFINTNKFFNTEYGKLLRTYLSQFKMNKMVNFEMVPIFDEALVSSVILTMEKSSPNLTFDYLEFNNEDITQEKFNSQKENKFTNIDNSLLSNDFWLFNRIEEQAIISKMKKKGNELSSFDSIQIKRGITTGFDAAFIINETNNLIDSDLARNFLRGKDIHRYKIEKNNLKLLFVPWHYPLHADESISGASELAENTFKDKYYNEYKHLQSFKTELSNRNKSETGKRYEWYALQRCAASYYPLFNEEKIVWGLISGGWDFAYDNEGHLLTSSSFFLTSETIPLKFILALFNSKLYQFYFSIVGEKTAGGAYVFKKTTIEKFLIPNNLTKVREITENVELIIREDSNELRDRYENNINQLVYSIYDLTEAEIKIVEAATA